MARIFITGSSDGLGLLATKALIDQGHKVVLHARNEERANQTRSKFSSEEKVLIADLSNVDETKKLADQVNALGRFDAIIHNAGVYEASNKLICNVNTLAPYILTCLIEKPKRLIYLSSGMHKQGRFDPKTFKSNSGHISYSDTKLHVLLLCKAVALKWPDVYANAINPGWVPTKMGGRGAPDDLKKGYETQVWLAGSNDANAQVSGRYFFHQKEVPSNPDADNLLLQEGLMRWCREITGVAFRE